MSKPKPWTELEKDILAVIRNSGDTVVTSGDLCKRHQLEPMSRVVDNALKRLKSGGKIFFDRKLGWLAT